MHDAFQIGIPVLAILLGILLNQRGVERLEGRIDRIEARMDRMQSELTSRMDRTQSDLTSRMDRMQSDLTHFYRIQAEQGTKVDILMEERRKP